MGFQPGRIMFAATLFAGMIAAPSAFAQPGPQGPVTLEAYKASQKQRFESMDANHDGIVTKEELAAQMAARMDEPPPQERIDSMFKMLDTDGDGKATAAEAEAAAATRFTTLDTDHDGTLTPEERRAGMGGMRGRQ